MQTIPKLLNGENCLIKSESNSGKTLCFLISLLENNNKAIILSPTKELNA